MLHGLTYWARPFLWCGDGKKCHHKTKAEKSGIRYIILYTKLTPAQTLSLVIPTTLLRDGAYQLKIISAREALIISTLSPRKVAWFTRLIKTDNWKTSVRIWHNGYDEMFRQDLEIFGNCKPVMLLALHCTTCLCHVVEFTIKRTMKLLDSLKCFSQ